MKTDTLTDESLREFLLGKLNDDGDEQVESLFLIDSQFRERLLALEHELVDDYLEQSLTIEDRERFVSKYAETPEQRRKLRIAKAIKNRAMIESAMSRPVAKDQSWSVLQVLQPRVLIPITLAVLVGMVVAIYVLNWRDDAGKNQHLAILQELAQLNSPANLKQVPPQMISLGLLPVTTRSAQTQVEIKTGSPILLIQFDLGLVEERSYFTYWIELRRSGSDEAYRITDLHEVEDGTSVRMRLPTSILSRGQYMIRLNGSTAAGSSSLVDEYSFIVIE